MAMPRIVTFSIVTAVGFVAIAGLGRVLASSDDAHQKQKPNLASIFSSAPGSKSPDGLFAGKPFEARSGAKFVKLNMVFDPPVMASDIQVEACTGEFRDGVEFYTFPGNRRFYGEGGRDSVSVQVVEKSHPGEPVEVRSLAVNFRHNEPLCIKSLRFHGPNGVEIAVNSPVAERLFEPSKNYEHISSIFSKARLGELLDHEFSLRQDREKWIFRFRGDGTFFVFGSSDQADGPSRLTALGDFEIRSSKKNGLTLHLKGRRLVTAEPWDGWLCGQLCGARVLAQSLVVNEDCARVLAQSLVVNEELFIERAKNGAIMIRNRTSKETRTLPFSDLRVRSSVL